MFLSSQIVWVMGCLLCASLWPSCKKNKTNKVSGIFKSWRFHGKWYLYIVIWFCCGWDVHREVREELLDQPGLRERFLKRQCFSSGSSVPLPSVQFAYLKIPNNTWKYKQESKIHPNLFTQRWSHFDILVNTLPGKYVYVCE